ncbi:hypothetical protein CARUB_v10023428mg [Capsella rubella]|uniref:F-box domain-containing protein n=1 Tax=Capsella rubella TaxID=81985 RepID=R0HTC6_9BRAS|nr:putative F-box protein At3g16590 [Capsella rubella]EOA27308.1 hypothetical protein CARUB_v10023428mg [Capsella rubella]
MAPSEQLPLDSVGEILCRLPRNSLARLRVVCKQWNATWEDRSFLNNYFTHARPQFILRTNSEIYSVDIINLNLDHGSQIDVSEIGLDYIPCKMITSLVHCDGFFLSDMFKRGFVIWNPWLRQSRWVVPEDTREYRFCGIGYDNTRPETGYKIFGFCICFDGTRQLYPNPKVAIYDCKSDACKFIVNASWGKDWRVPELDSIVSFNGNLYWVAYDSKTCEHFIRSFDFSKEMFKTFCLLPCNEEEDFAITQVLAVFRGDRFSVLRQSYMTRKVEILVTKHKIDSNGEAVVWKSLMKVSIPDFPRLQQKCFGGSGPSYFVDNKMLFVCTSDETGHPCIYIVQEDVFRKISIDSVVDRWSSCLTYIPSFVSIPLAQRNNKDRL